MMKNENLLFSFLYLGCSLLGDIGYKASRCLTIGRNLYYLLKVSDCNYNNKNKNGRQL